MARTIHRRWRNALIAVRLVAGDGLADDPVELNGAASARVKIKILLDMDDKASVIRTVQQIPKRDPVTSLHDCIGGCI